MRIVSDADGPAMPDVKVPEFARDAVANNRDVHSSNCLVFDWLRASLCQTPAAARPEVTCCLYGVEVEIDEHGSVSDWPKEANIGIKALEIIIWENLDHAKLKRETS